MQLVCTGFTTSRAGTIMYWKTHHKYEPGWNLSINHAGSRVPTFKLKNRVEASPEANTAPTRQKRSRDLEQTHSFLTWGDGSWLRCCIHEKESQRPLESSLRSQPDFRPHHLLTFSHLGKCREPQDRSSSLARHKSSLDDANGTVFFCSRSPKHLRIWSSPSLLHSSDGVGP